VGWSGDAFKHISLFINGLTSRDARYDMLLAPDFVAAEFHCLIVPIAV